MTGAKSSRPPNHGLTWWMPPLLTSSGFWLARTRRWSFTASRTIGSALRRRAAVERDRQQHEGRHGSGRPERPRPASRPRGGLATAPATGHWAASRRLRASGRRVLGQPALEDLRKGVLGGVLAGARGAAFQMGGDVGVGRGVEPAPLVVEEVLPRPVAGLPTRSSRVVLEALRGGRPRARARRDFTVPTAQAMTSATSTSVRPSRSSRITVRASSDSVMSACSISSPTSLRSRSSSMSSRSHSSWTFGALVASDGVESAHRRVVAAAPILADERVPEDPEQPRLEVRAGSELARALERAGVGLLDEVLGVVWLPVR